MTDKHFTLWGMGKRNKEMEQWPIKSFNLCSDIVFFLTSPPTILLHFTKHKMLLYYINGRLFKKSSVF